MNLFSIQTTDWSKEFFSLFMDLYLLPVTSGKPYTLKQIKLINGQTNKIRCRYQLRTLEIMIYGCLYIYKIVLFHRSDKDLTKLCFRNFSEEISRLYSVTLCCKFTRNFNRLLMYSKNIILKFTVVNQNFGLREY